MTQLKFERFYKFVNPSPEVKAVPDSQDITGGLSYAVHSWYQRLIQGSSTRLTRYREYDMMDDDVDINRALDTIAEEMCPKDSTTGLPFKIKFHDIETNISDSNAVTLMAALRYWNEIQEFDARLFNVARNLIKYGDVMFDKSKGSTQKWSHIHPRTVLAAVVDEDDVTKINGWMVRDDLKEATGQTTGYSTITGQEFSTKIMPKHEVCHISLCDDMSTVAPFGESILKSVYRSFKQKEMLEDAVIIYRIVRAPERRVFYIDGGKMPPHRAKTFLEQVKNEMKQKKIPTQNREGTPQVESVYNPHCLDLSTMIPLLDGRELSLQNIITEYNQGKELWAYSCNPITGEMAPGLISWAGVTRTNTKVIKLTLDNGKELICTPDHKIPVQGKGFVEAQHLTSEDSLIPFNTKLTPIKNSKSYTYMQIYCNHTKQWKYVHREVAKFIVEYGIDLTHVKNEKYSNGPFDTIHHINFNRYDNTPSNLVLMNNKDHVEYHSSNMIGAWTGYKQYLTRLKQDPIAYDAHFNKCAQSRTISVESDPMLKDKLNTLFLEHCFPLRAKLSNTPLQFSSQMFDIVYNTLTNNKCLSVKEHLHLLNTNSVFMSMYSDLNSNISDKSTTLNKIKTDTFSKRSLDLLLKQFGYPNWKTLKNSIIVDNSFNNINLPVLNEQKTQLIKLVFQFAKEFTPRNFSIVTALKYNSELQQTFCKLYNDCFSTNITVCTSYNLDQVAKLASYTSFKDMMYNTQLFNHKIVSITEESSRDVGTLTIDQHEQFHDYHTFAVSSGIYVKNSTNEDFFFLTKEGGRGSRVEVLPGGNSTGEVDDVYMLVHKVFRGLRIPTSYISIPGKDSTPIFNDGQKGQAYQEEIQFIKFCMRLQKNMSIKFDAEFKNFLRELNIKFDPTAWSLEMVEPSNFTKYKQQAVDSELLSVLNNATSLGDMLSKRFTLLRFGQFTEEELLRNERLMREEKGVALDDPMYYKKIYSSPEENQDNLGDLGGGGGFGGGGAGSTTDLSGDMTSDDELGDLGGDEGTDLGGEEPSLDTETAEPPPEK